MTKKTKQTCGVCQTELVPIAYGYPGPGMMESADRGEIVLGGCVVRADDPKWACPQCSGFTRSAEPETVTERPVESDLDW